MISDQCAVEVGTHPSPFWYDETANLMVCDRHRKQYDESELGPFTWVRVSNGPGYAAVEHNVFEDANEAGSMHEGLQVFKPASKLIPGSSVNTNSPRGRR